MTVIVSGRADVSAQGIRPFDPRRHLRDIAELVETVFASELDADGRMALREKETLGRWSPMLGTLLSSALFNDLLAGFVWLEEGRVVGNVTLQRQEDSGTRWRISNVAVAEPYRGRGIARLLMQATLREIARRGGSWAVLQVRIDNPPARRLYDRLNFMAVCQNGLWHSPGVPSELPDSDPNLPLRQLGARDWRARFELAQAGRPPLAHWAEPVYADDFRLGIARTFRRALGEFTGWQRVRQWGVWTDGYLMGEVHVVANGVGGAHRLSLTLRPTAPAAASATLLAQGLGVLRGAGTRSILAEYNGDRPEPVRSLEAAGFRPRRVLLTMRRLIVPGDADITIPGLDRN